MPSSTLAYARCFIVGLDAGLLFAGFCRADATDTGSGINLAFRRRAGLVGEPSALRALLAALCGGQIGQAWSASIQLAASSGGRWLTQALWWRAGLAEEPSTVDCRTLNLRPVFVTSLRQ